MAQTLWLLACVTSGLVCFIFASLLAAVIETVAEIESGRVPAPSYPAPRTKLNFLEYLARRKTTYHLQ